MITRDAGDLQFLAAAWDAAPVGFAVFDEDLRLVWMNRTVVELDEGPSERLIGRRMDELVPEPSRALIEIARRVLETGVPVMEHEAPGSEARSGRHFSVSYFPVELPGHRLAAHGAREGGGQALEPLYPAARQHDVGDVADHGGDAAAVTGQLLSLIHI